MRLRWAQQNKDMSAQKLMKLIALHHYPRYACGIWLRYKARQQAIAFQEKIRLSGVVAPTSVTFYGMPIIHMVQQSRIEIGENCVICSDSEMTALGVNHPVVMRTLRAGASIIIGKNTGISGGSICAAISVNIGNECLIGANVVIADTDFHAIDPIGRRFNNDPEKISAAPVIIEDNVFVGTGAIILKGVRVGKNSVIGAGSVVTKNVPPNSIIAGNPAVLVRSLDDNFDKSKLDVR
jgi:acetyltransferase-like isoleucine patch superfamily enzyme